MAARSSILTRQAGLEINGARPFDGYVEVLAPFGSYTYPHVDLDGGWYTFSMRGDGYAIHLALRDENGFSKTEIRATATSRAIVRLTGGSYALTVTCGARPGRYDIHDIELAKLSPLANARILGRRFWQALRRGTSVVTLIRLIGLSLRKTVSFGIKESASHATDQQPSQAPQTITQNIPSDFELEARMVRLDRKPIFKITITAKPEGRLDLGGQFYTNYTFNNDDQHDYELFLGSHISPSEDLLLLFAEHICKFPFQDLIIADELVRSSPAGWIAWDPILYHDKISTVYARKKKKAGDDIAPSPDKGRCGLIPIPVAARPEPRSPTDFSHTVKNAERPPCSIIIPTRDRADLLSSCLEGLFEATPWPHEVIVVDNGSVEPETQRLFDAYAEKGLKVIRADIPFNFSTLCNMGARASRHDQLLFLNNDIVITKSDWLEQMVKLAQLPAVGAVGARLLYADGRLQHGGVFLGGDEICWHAWRGLDRKMQDDIPQLRQTSLRSAVTGACLCVSAHKFEKIGGFDETHFPVTLNDVDLCLRLEESGWQTVYAAQAEAIHLEGETRGADLTDIQIQRRQAELRAFANRWPRSLEPDPFISPIHQFG